MQELRTGQGARPDRAGFLPDFCSLEPLFFLVLLAEILAVGIVLVSWHGWLDAGTDLALVSLIVQWTALGSAVALCLARDLLGRQGDRAEALGAWLLVVCVSWGVAALAFWLGGTEPLLVPIIDGSATGFVLRHVLLSGIVAALALRYLWVQREWRRRVVSEAHARLDALEARIRPHFLFNCLNTIASLARQDPRAAEAAVLDLAALMRAGLGRAGRTSTLGAELALCHHYLDIERQRLGARLAVRFDLGEVDEALPMPPLLLQPLVENAVYHGIEPLPAGGEVQVSARLAEGVLRLTVENPVPLERPSGRGHGMALGNVRERLEVQYGGRARLVVDALPERFRVTLVLPVVTSGAHPAGR